MGIILFYYFVLLDDDILLLYLKYGNIPQNFKICPNFLRAFNSIGYGISRKNPFPKY